VPRITALAIDPFSVLSRIKISVGSGVVIDDASNIVTNAHVVVGAKKIIIAIGDDLTEDAEVVGIDPISDLAVVRTADRSIRLPKAALGSSHSLEIGEDLLAIGYPFGLGLTATKGIVSGAERVLPLFSLSWMTPLIQTDAALNPGNSGGPIVNLCGEVVGISTLSATKAQNLNFAIPIDAVRELVPQLLEQGHIVRAWHGINGKMVPPILQYGLGMEPGFLVETIEPGSPAERIGLRGGTLPVMIVTQEYVLGGDIITAVNGASLSTIDDVVKIARSLKVGDRLTLTYWRDGEEATATVTLPERPILPEDLERFQRD
jgi:putative serine protease PepD